jgi:hypothetical protein
MSPRLIKDVSFFAVTAALSAFIVLWLAPKVVALRDRAENAARVERAAEQLRAQTPYDVFLAAASLTIGAALEKPPQRERLGLDPFEAARLRVQLGQKEQREELARQIESAGRAHARIHLRNEPQPEKTVDVDIDLQEIRLTVAEKRLTMPAPAFLQ